MDKITRTVTHDQHHTDIEQLFGDVWAVIKCNYREDEMPKGYNSLNDLKTNPYEIGICPICSIRLTHGCEHSQTQLAQEWLAAVIVAEQEKVKFVWNEPADPRTTAEREQDEAGADLLATQRDAVI